MKLTYVFLAGVALAAISARGAIAQDEAPATDDRAAIIDSLEPRPETPLVNTAIAFTNTSGRPVKVRLRAYDHDGELRGRVQFTLEPRVLKYFFVSRMLGAVDPDFVGWVEGMTSAPISASAVLVGAGTTDLPVERRRVPSVDSVDAQRFYGLVFPLVAAF